MRKDTAAPRRILHADIENFFPTISLARLVALFSRFGLHPTVAELLARFSTINDRLPLGLNASPLFANLICIDLDEKMHSLARTYETAYSRYADDLTFSGKGDLPAKFDISNILTHEGFRLSERKYVRRNAIAYGIDVACDFMSRPRGY